MTKTFVCPGKFTYLCVRLCVSVGYSYDLDILYGIKRKRTYANVCEHTQTFRNVLLHTYIYTALYILDMI